VHGHITQVKPNSEHSLVVMLPVKPCNRLFSPLRLTVRCTTHVGEDIDHRQVAFKRLDEPRALILSTRALHERHVSARLECSLETFDSLLEGWRSIRTPAHIGI
jgi:hypothetical protein